MPVDLKQFELNRIVNMLKSMEWTVVSSGFQGHKVVATFEKTAPGMNVDLKKIEADRITTMLKSFTWDVVGAEYPENKIVLKFEKVVKGEVG
jgi:hypothetical protein